MNTILSELQELIALYRDSAEKLALVSNRTRQADEETLADSILQQQNNLKTIHAMDSRVTRLTALWKTTESQFDPESRKEVQLAIEILKTEGRRTKALCDILTQRIQAIKENLGKNLEKVGKHNQYLDCIKPVKCNYPKFIDSHC
jgi:hypothetical protein